VAGLPSEAILTDGGFWTLGRPPNSAVAMDFRARIRIAALTQTVKARSTLERGFVG
jgi:hypothetical protein